MNIDTRIKFFFIIFGTVYFLESIGGFYMTTAIVYIEKQFQIPSRLSGTMVSAGDFAYIPMVIFTSYFGGKGNRARWIGGGCILIAIANVLISSSNFLFPVEKFHVNSSYIKNSVAYEVNSFVLHKEEADAADVWLNATLHQVQSENNNTEVITSYNVGPVVHDYRFIQYQAYCFYNNQSDMCKEMETRFGEKHETTPEDVSAVRVLTSLPYSFCHSTVNQLRLDHKADECKKEKAGKGPFYMIFIGLLILGVGRTMPFSLGLPLMDDNVSKSNLPIYFAIMFFVRILGPVIGLLVGSKLNTIYYNFKPPQGLTVVDPMWIGCWWLGFLLFGIVLFFPSVALALFPSDDLDDNEDIPETVALNGLNGANREKTELKVEAQATKSKKRLNLRDKHVKNDDHKDFWEKLSEFGNVVKTLFKNKIYVGCMLGRIVDVLAFKGFFVFLGKYLELEFGVPQYRIQRYLALTGVVGFAIGVMSGSLAMKKLKFQGRNAAAWVAAASALAALTTFINGSIGCKSVIGNIGDQARTNNFVFPSCRPDCLCSDMPLYPVCNSNGDVFYSPCHAGCPLSGANFTIYQNEKDDKQVDLIFTECECARTKDLKALGAMVGGMAVVPGMMIILRAVKPEHRSISLGFNGFLVSLFATLPSPIFWGKIFDSSCLMWQTVCGIPGACPIYDTDDLRFKLFTIYGCMRVFSLLSDIWTWVWAKDLKLTEEQEEEEQKEDGNGEEKVPEAKSML